MRKLKSLSLDKYNMQLEKEIPSNRKFGIFFGVLLSIVGVFFIGEKHPLIFRLCLLASAIFLLLAIFRPSLLKVLNRLWMSLGWYLGLVINPIIMAFIYLAFFMPFGIIRRISGTDELKLKNTYDHSFWLYKSDEGIKNIDLRKQY